MCRVGSPVPQARAAGHAAAAGLSRYHEVRVGHADAAGRDEAIDAALLLTSIEHETEPASRTGAVLGRGRWGGEAAGAVLLRHLRHDDPPARLAVAKRLDRHHPGALASWLPLTEDPDAAVRDRSLFGLVLAAGGRSSVPWLRRRRGSMRRPAARAGARRAVAPAQR